MSDTTAMIDVTATMLPSTVISDRSFEPQMAWSAIDADSRILLRFSTVDGLPQPCQARPPYLPLAVVFSTLTVVAVGHAADRVVRPGDDLVAGLEARDDLEVLVAGNAHLDRQELDRLALADDEHAFGFLARLAGLQFGRRGDGLHRAGGACRSVGSLTTWPLASYTSSRTATAAIGTAVTFGRVAVVMSAVQVKPGRTSGMSPSITTTTLKLVA